MNTTDDLDLRLSDWMASAVPSREPDGLVDRTVAGLGQTRQRPRLLVWTGVGRPLVDALAFAPAWRFALVLLLLLAVAAAAVVVGSRLIATPQPNRLGGFVEGPSLPVGDGRYDEAVALRDGRILVLAHTDNGSLTLLLDPATGAMTRAADPPRAVSIESNEVLADGRVLFVGDNASHEYFGHAVLYDPATDTYREVGPTTDPRIFPLLVSLADGRVLVAGGEFEGAVPTAEIFDPVTETFSVTGPMTRPRGGDAGAVLLPDGRVLIVGGSGASMDASAELFDPQTGTFSRTGSMAAPRVDFTTSALADGRVLFASGLIETGETTHDNTVMAEIYDPATGRFSTTGPMSESRIMHAAAALPDGTVLVVGGATGWSEAHPGLVPVRTAERYDPVTGLFTPVAPMANPRSEFNRGLRHRWARPHPRPLGPARWASAERRGPTPVADV